MGKYDHLLPKWVFDLHPDVQKSVKPRVLRCAGYDDETLYFNGNDLRAVAEAAFKAGQRSRDEAEAALKGGHT